jgi:hypothetical protein
VSLADTINSLTNSIVNFANDLTTRFDTGFFGILTWLLAKLIKVLMLAQLKMMLVTIGFAWSIAKSIIADLGILNILGDLLNSLSPEVSAFLGFMGFNEIFNTLVTAIVTRYVLRFLPFGK